MVSLCRLWTLSLVLLVFGCVDDAVPVLTPCEVDTDCSTRCLDGYCVSPDELEGQGGANGGESAGGVTGNGGQA
ncbi:MAG: hypothetical protein ACPGQS_09120, partial [Bradymonadia bacterium]